MTTSRRWSETEKAHLANHYPFVSAEELRALLPDRSVPAIKLAAGEMHLKKCHERLREMGRMNVAIRWGKTPPVQ